MTLASSPVSRAEQPARWQWPVDPARSDTTPAIREAEKDAIIGLGTGGRRLLARHDPESRNGSKSGGWSGRLTTPAANSMRRPRLTAAGPDRRRAAEVRRGRPVLLVVDR